MFAILEAILIYALFILDILMIFRPWILQRLTHKRWDKRTDTLISCPEFTERLLCESPLSTS